MSRRIGTGRRGPVVAVGLVTLLVVSAIPTVSPIPGGPLPGAPVVGQADTTGVPGDAAWRTVTLDPDVASPVVVATANSEHGGQSPKVAEVRDVQPGSFQLRVCEHESGSGCDSHAAEDVGWVALDARSADAVEGVAAGTVTLSGTGPSGEVVVDFGELLVDPVVLAQIQDADATEAVAEVSDVRSQTARVTVCAANGGSDGCGTAGPYTVAWIATDAAERPLAGVDAGLTSMADSTWTSRALLPAGVDPPAVVASTQTDTDPERRTPAMVRRVEPASMEVRYCEHDGGDVCDDHSLETVGWAAFDPGPVQVRPASRPARTATGSIAFNGTASLPVFPCPTSRDCTDGSFQANFQGSLAGVVEDHRFAFSWATVDEPLTGSFSYFEIECSQAGGLLAGRAEGSGQGSVPLGQVGGRWFAPDDVAGRQVLGVELAFDFTWVRVLNAASIQLDNVTLTADVERLGPVTVVDDASLSEGQAHFVPDHAGSGVPTCSEPAEDVTGRFDGIAEVST